MCSSDLHDRKQNRMNIATKNDVEKHREELRKDREERRKRKEEIGIIPSELTRLGKGIMEEGNYDEDEEGYVRIPKSVLDRHLNRTKEDIALWAKQMGYKSVEEWLKITNALSSAQKGSLLKMK